MDDYRIILLMDQKSDYQDFANLIDECLSVPAEITKSFDIIDAVNRILFDKIDLVIVDRDFLYKNDSRRIHYFLNKVQNIPVAQLLKTETFKELKKSNQLPEYFINREQSTNNEISDMILKALYNRLPKLN